MCGIDVRSLAIFRISIACILLGDLWLRARNSVAFYSDAGVLPRSAVARLYPEAGQSFSLHMLSGTVGWELFLFAVAGLFAVALLVGYHARWATLLSWILLTSLHNRNPPILLGGDYILRILLFWSLFLPLGACYSIDAALNSEAAPLPKRVCSVATVGILLQVCCIYWCTALLKTDRSWRVDGTAIYYALSFGPYATRIGQALLGYPQLLHALTFATLIQEGLVPCLAWLPLYTAYLRTAITFMFIGLHVGMALCLQLGWFPYTCAAAWLLFLPSAFWDILASRRSLAATAGFTILYNPDCPGRQKLLLLMRSFLMLPASIHLAPTGPKARHRPRAAHSSVPGQRRSDISWMVETDQGDCYTGWPAVLSLSRLSPLGPVVYPLLSKEPLHRCMTNLYGWSAGRLRRCADKDRYLRYRALPVTSPHFVHAVVACFVVYMVWWNVSGFAAIPASARLPNSLRRVGYWLRLDQRWGMFAPGPPRYSGWYVIPARLQDGRFVDLFRDGARLTWEKPALISPLFKNPLWRRYMVQCIGFHPHSAALPLFCSYLCRHWNEAHPPEQQIQFLTVYFMEEDIRLDGQQPPIRPVLLTFYRRRPAYRRALP